MNIGFIGAGKAGTALGRYFRLKGLPISGFFDSNSASALCAAEETQSLVFSDIREAVNRSEILILSVPDGAISSVWESLCGFDIKGKILVHLSGAYTAEELLCGAKEKGAYAFSVHPLIAMTDNMPLRDMEKAHFCIEGDKERIDAIKELLCKCGNTVHIIPSEKKPLYHAAAVFASNFAASLMAEGTELMMWCGFNREDAFTALVPIILANTGAMCEKGFENALTGPVERCDTGTVAKHMHVLDGSDRELYRLLSLKLIGIAEGKHPEYDYSEMKNILKGVEQDAEKI